MELPCLPIELFSKVVRTSRYLEARDVLHDNDMWRNVRWYTTSGDVTRVPEEWQRLSWLPQLIRALCNPDVRHVHVTTVRG